jgi:hypothetical protein
MQKKCSLPCSCRPHQREAGGKRQRQVLYGSLIPRPFRHLSLANGSAHSQKQRRGWHWRSCVTCAHRNRCQRDEAQGPKSSGQPRREPQPLLKAPVPTSPICDKRAPSTKTHCFRMHFGPRSTKDKDAPQQKTCNTAGIQSLSVGMGRPAKRSLMSSVPAHENNFCPSSSRELVASIKNQ